MRRSIGVPAPGTTRAGPAPPGRGIILASMGNVIKRKSTLFLVLLVVFANLGLWAAINWPAQAPAWSGPIKGVSFSPYHPGQDPQAGRYPGVEEMDADLARVAGMVRKVRTYSSIDGFENIPRLAEKYDLAVTAGAWLDKRGERNEREIVNLIRNARTYRNIDRVIVGNESVLRADLTVPELIRYLRQVKRAVNVPVSTAEPWHVWHDHPELAREVDYIAVHILPYWEGVPRADALDHVMMRYRDLRRAFPGKPILIAEVGWPSAGHRFGDAEPSRVDQAEFVRGFLNLAARERLDYFVMEVFDQGWKRGLEGEVGAHWGLLDAEREQKFPFTGPVAEYPHWQFQALLATLLALLPMIWFLWRWHNIANAGRLVFTLLIQVAVSLLIWTLFMPANIEIGKLGLLIWGVLLPAQLALMLVVLINGFELTELLWRKRLKLRFPDSELRRTEKLPMVSLHLAIYNEPPELVIQTLDSLAALNYPDFEVLVIDNNTRDAAVWLPVKAHCERLGPRFRFFTLGQWKGFKAGALNFALGQTDPRAEVIGVVDSDYEVRSDWLRRLAPYFRRPQVGFVQAPQDHRAWELDRFKEMINWEYAGFFHIGMVHRAQRNAIIQHGTMTLIRRRALERVGGWSEWCICEDAELGLRLMQDGYESVYVNEPFGKGLTPDSFTGYKKQRFRWVYGAVQILKSHWHELLPWHEGGLTLAQRYHFAAGWLPWFGDGLHLVFSTLALAWTAGLVLLPRYFDFPLAAFLVPTLGMFAFKVLHSLWLYAARVRCSRRQRLGAAVAGMALTHTIARGVIKGLLTNNAPFFRTPKSEDKPALMAGLAMAAEELTMLGLLWGGCIAVLAVYGPNHPEALLWATVLAVQSLPYVAALALSMANAFPAQAPIGLPAPEARKARAPMPATITRTTA